MLILHDCVLSLHFFMRILYKAVFVTVKIVFYCLLSSCDVPMRGFLAGVDYWLILNLV